MMAQVASTGAMPGWSVYQISNGGLQFWFWSAWAPHGGLHGHAPTREEAVGLAQAAAEHLRLFQP